MEYGVDTMQGLHAFDVWPTNPKCSASDYAFLLGNCHDNTERSPMYQITVLFRIFEQHHIHLGDIFTAASIWRYASIAIIHHESYCTDCV